MASKVLTIWSTGCYAVDHEVNRLFQMETVPLSQLLRELRTSRGTSLRAAARDLSVDPAYLSRIERGEKTASRGVLERAADYYGIPTADLLPTGVPPDVAAILREHPEAVDELRRRYGSG